MLFDETRGKPQQLVVCSLRRSDCLMSINHKTHSVCGRVADSRQRERSCFLLSSTCDCSLLQHNMGKMLGDQWLPWINNPPAGSISVTEQETPPGFLGTREAARCPPVCPVLGLSALCLLLLLSCVALSVLYNNESDSKPGWKSLLFDYQNISDSYLAITTANHHLKRDNELLREQSARQQQQTELLNSTSADLTSAHLALSLESAELAEQIANLTSANVRLAQELQRLVRYTSEQEGKELDMSETIRHMADSATRREEEARRLSRMNGLLRDELLQVKEKNQRLLEVNDGFQGEVKDLSDDCGRVRELEEQKQKLSSVLVTERKEAAEREESRRDEIDSLKEAFRSLDLYCPVVHLKTKERICRTCPDSWRLFENKCYFFSSRLLTWSSSRAWCQTQGGDLLIVNSRPEQSFVFESSRALQPGGSRRWIGLTDAEEEGDWRWVDGSEVTSDVQFWLSRPGLGAEPDDWKLDNPRGEDCGHMDASEKALKSWMDASCETPYRWICEKNV